MTNGDDYAFPVIPNDNPNDFQPGMTKREQMALSLTAAYITANYSSPVSAALITTNLLIGKLNKNDDPGT